MSLNIHIEADQGEMRAFAEWLKSIGKRVDGASEGVSNSMTRSYDGWSGEGSSGFHSTMSTFRPGIDGLSSGYEGAGNALDLHANDVTTAKARMRQALDIARGAGLDCTDREIFEPGPPPPDPEPSGPGSSDAERRENGAMWKAWLDWKEKAEAYADCTVAVSEGRRLETDSQGIFIDYLTNVAEKWHINGADFVTGLAAGYVGQQSTWRANAKSLAEGAAKSSLKAYDPSTTTAQRAIYESDAALQRWGAKVNLEKAESNLVGKWVEKLPSRAQKVVVAEWKKFIPNNAPYLSKAPAVLKKVPVVGTVLTGGSVIIDVAQGKDVGLSIASNGGGLVAGAATGGAIGGPVGAVAGFVVSTGTGFLIEEFGPEVADYVKERYGEITTNPPPMPNDPRIPGPQ